VQCTRLKTGGKVVKRCSIAYCQRCLANRYEERLADIKGFEEKLEGHVCDVGYTWSCPSCRKECNCSICRKKMGLTALGYIFEKY
jgi:hypothetical protein